MNNPMKLKYHSLYGQLLQDRMLMNAWKQVKANKGSGGIDGVTINEYAKNEKEWYYVKISDNLNVRIICSSPLIT